MGTVVQLSEFEYRRKAARMRHSGVGTLLFDGHAMMCRVEDVSSNGARVVTSDLPDVGEKVHLDLPGIGRYVARVVHIAGDGIGVEFVAEIPS
jgi:hypothetical protein